MKMAVARWITLGTYLVCAPPSYAGFGQFGGGLERASSGFAAFNVDEDDYQQELRILIKRARALPVDPSSADALKTLGRELMRIRNEQILAVSSPEWTTLDRIIREKSGALETMRMEKFFEGERAALDDRAYAATIQHGDSVDRLGLPTDFLQARIVLERDFSNQKWLSMRPVDSPVVRVGEIRTHRGQAVGRRKSLWRFDQAAIQQIGRMVFHER